MKKQVLQIPPWVSPIKHVAKAAPILPAAIAPERIGELQVVVRDLKLTLEDSDTWEFHVSRKDREVVVSRRVFELLWCAAFAYCSIYMRLFQHQKPEELTLIDLHEDPDLSRAVSLLSWAFEATINGLSSPWPDGLPQPQQHPVHASLEHLADELSLSAVAFITLHELGHDYLGHEGGDSSVEQEREADYFAADWILEEVVESSIEFIKRSIGMSIGLMITTALGIHTRSFVMDTHPHPFDRLMNCLDRAIEDENHIAWAFVIASWTLHLDNSPYPIDKGVRYPTFRECVDQYVEHMSIVAQKENQRDVKSYQQAMMRMTCPFAGSR